MSTLKVNKIQPYSGDNINFDGNFIPSSSNGSNLTLGTVANPWSELYVSTGSVVFAAETSTVAALKAGGEVVVGAGQTYGMIFTETTSSLRGSFSVGRDNQALGTASLANGINNTSSGNYSHAEGYRNRSTGTYSHAEGWFTQAVEEGSHSEGRTTIALGQSSHAEGLSTIASGSYSHAEGYTTFAGGISSHAEGLSTSASGDYSHAEGQGSKALGNSSHAEGVGTVAFGVASHTEGLNTVASGSYQSVVGQWNALDNSSSLFVVGAGIFSTRKDGFSVELDSQNVRPHIVIPSNTGNPANPKSGSMYFNASTNFLYIYNGTAWRSASFA